MEGLKDNVFIVTGGGSGIGAATVSRLLAEGARVAAAGTRPDGLARTRTAAGAAADNLLTVRFDLRDEASIRSLVAQTVDGFGRLDGVANVAAGVVPGMLDRDQGVDTLDVDLWAETLRINLIGTGLVIRESLPAIVAAGADRSSMSPRPRHGSAKPHTPPMPRPKSVYTASRATPPEPGATRTYGAMPSRPAKSLATRA
ncbi:MAG: hypothetical protein QOF66_3755 [Mycobacterium sp.]|jgi:NAD(P)-dependent dehydrogenase (short-subunit alcohol dehydrogenase family)|nr:hypothetical protein [Mycobacterium sp.]